MDDSSGCRGTRCSSRSGYDAFGIHSENYALRIGEHPMRLIPRNIANFRRQLERGGLMVDWRYSVDTTDPRYYKWTQWVFLKLYEKGLAYKKKAAVNWCPNDKTVLANEQVINGACERCGAMVEQRFLEQWFFRISEYAERLLNNLDHIDWSETTKTAQRNWIGRSDGAEIEFEVSGIGNRESGIGGVGEAACERSRNSDSRFPIPDSRDHGLHHPPRHDLRRDLPGARARASARREPNDRRPARRGRGVSGAHEAPGPRLAEGARRRRPASSRAATRPIRPPARPSRSGSPTTCSWSTAPARSWPCRDTTSATSSSRTSSRCPIVRVVAGEGENEHTPLDAAVHRKHGGRLVNSGQFDGMPVPEAKRAITEWLASRGAGRAVVNYRLHDWCISRQRYWGPPIPMIYCDACGPQPVPEKDLPVTAAGH